MAVFDRKRQAVKDAPVDREGESYGLAASKGAGGANSEGSPKGDGSTSALNRGKETIDQRRVKAARHPVRVQILNILTEDGPHSPKRISEKTGHSLNLVSYHMSTVLYGECQLIELFEEIPRRGAVEHVYKIKNRSGDRSPRLAEDVAEDHDRQCQGNRSQVIP
ncbi:MAG TPA: winged helix-turn-helix domain-containing protein [Solirubrobacterales bacterium]|nr:winged helix-turn-helix domain-containing protein [Solirubrobacterales bacterium]